MNKKKQTVKDLDVEIGLDQDQEWSKEKLARVKAFIENESKKQSPIQRLENEMLSIQYQMEEYLNNNTVHQQLDIGDFINQYLKLLKITRRKLADIVEMKDTNLYKYLTGERKLNTDLAMKLSYFFHTPPEIWFNIQTKNQLDELKKKKEHSLKYKRYDYTKVLQLK